MIVDINKNQSKPKINKQTNKQKQNKKNPNKIFDFRGVKIKRNCRSKSRLIIIFLLLEIIYIEIQK